MGDRDQAGGGLRVGSARYARVAIALFLAGLVTFGVLYSTQPLLPLIAAADQVSAAEASLSVSVTTAALAAGLLIAGGLSDRFGRKPVMVVSVLSSAVLAVASGLAPSFGLLLALRALTGLTLAGLPAVAMTYLAEEVASTSVGLAMGIYVSGNSVGGMGGRLVVGFLADAVGERGALIGLGVIALVLAATFALLLPGSRRFGHARGASRGLRRWLVPLRDPCLVVLFLEVALLMGGFVTAYNYLSFRLTAPPYLLSTGAVSLIFLVYLAGTLSSTVTGRLVDRHGRRRLLPPAIAVMAVGVALTLAAPPVLIVLGLALLTFGFFGAHSTASSWVSGRGAAARAQATASYLVCYYVGSSIAGYAGGAFWHVARWPGVVAFVGTLVGVALLGSLALFWVTRPGGAWAEPRPGAAPRSDAA